jgi:hypothetical protein
MSMRLTHRRSADVTPLATATAAALLACKSLLRRWGGGETVPPKDFNE